MFPPVVMSGFVPRPAQVHFMVSDGFEVIGAGKRQGVKGVGARLGRRTESESEGKAGMKIMDIQNCLGRIGKSADSGSYRPRPTPTSYSLYTGSWKRFVLPTRTPSA